MEAARTIDGDRVILERVAPHHVGDLRRLHLTPQVRRWWRAPGPHWPFDDEDAAGYAVLLRGRGGTPSGFVQYSEESDPDYRHAGIDIFLDPSLHGQGYGREVVATLAAHLIDERGHHRLVIDPAAGNAAAIACYASVGFRPVGIMRRYEQGEDGAFHDGLLMDLLAEELIRWRPAPG